MSEIPAEAVHAAIAEGRAIVCYTRCWPCQFGHHFEPPKAHTWMDQEEQTGSSND